MTRTIDLDKLDDYDQETLLAASQAIAERLGPSQAWDTLSTLSATLRDDQCALVVASRFDPDHPLRLDTLGNQPVVDGYESFRTRNVLLLVRASMMIDQLLLIGAQHARLGPSGAREMFWGVARRMQEDIEKEGGEDGVPVRH